MTLKIKSSFKKPSITGLFFNVGGALLLACVANVLVFALRLDHDTKSDIKFPIPGYTIGIIWLLLFAGMGLAKWVLTFQDAAKTKKADFWITILICSCAAWIFLLAAKHIYVGAAGNFVIILLSIITAVNCFKISKTAAFLILPVVLWVSLATAILMILIFGR